MYNYLNHCFLFANKYIRRLHVLLGCRWLKLPSHLPRGQMRLLCPLTQIRFTKFPGNADPGGWARTHALTLGTFDVEALNASALCAGWIGCSPEPQKFHTRERDCRVWLSAAAGGCRAAISGPLVSGSQSPWQSKKRKRKHSVLPLT